MNVPAAPASTPAARAGESQPGRRQRPQAPEQPSENRQRENRQCCEHRLAMSPPISIAMWLFRRRLEIRYIAMAATTASGTKRSARKMPPFPSGRAMPVDQPEAEGGNAQRVGELHPEHRCRHRRHHVRPRTQPQHISIAETAIPAPRPSTKPPATACRRTGSRSADSAAMRSSVFMLSSPTCAAQRFQAAMNADLHRRFRHAVAFSGLRRRQTFDLHIADQLPGLLRKHVQQAVDVELCFHGVCVFRREQNIGIVQRLLRPAPGTAEVIDQLVARDRVHPGGKWPGRIVGGTARMHGDQGFLQQVLRIGRPAQPTRR